jgi:outer membrane protein assembly factor BamB
MKKRSLPVMLVLAATLATLPSGRATAASDDDWPMYGRNNQRTAFNADEQSINRTSVALLRPKWFFHTNAGVTASPAVINAFDTYCPGKPRKAVFVGSADGIFYALDATTTSLTGSVLWQTPADAEDLSSNYGAFASSPFVDVSRRQIYVGGGFALYAFDLCDGHKTWKWSTKELGRGEIESSPLMLERSGGGTVYFGSDLDGTITNGGSGEFFPAIYAVSADTGQLGWYWRPSFSTYNGNTGSRICGDVWSSIATDVAASEEGLLYFGTADCGSGNQGNWNEAIVAIDVDPPAATCSVIPCQRLDSPNWFYQPHPGDVLDRDFGSTPMLFENCQKLDGTVVPHCLGVGGKDGTMYVLDRSADRDMSGNVTRNGVVRTPLWSVQVTQGGFAAGFIGSQATDGKRIYGATALFDDSGTNAPVQPPFMHAFNVKDNPASLGRIVGGDSAGTIAWQQITTGPSFAATTAIDGVVFVGGLVPTIQALDANTGQVLWVSPTIGSIASGPAISAGEVFVGSGISVQGLGEQPLQGVHAFTLDVPVAGQEMLPPPLPPMPWPFGVIGPPIFTSQP